MLLRIHSENPQMRLIKKAAQVLDDGGIVVYPTDTAYGMGCDLFNKRTIEKIYEIKKRSKKQPFSFICTDLGDISSYAVVTNYAYKIMRHLLPGPYTFVLEASRLVPKSLMPKRKEVGIRIPDNEICLSLVREFGGPIISTTVKSREGEILTDPDMIEKELGQSVDVTIDGGILFPELSTIVNLVNDTPEIVREGKGNPDVF
ncbi:MAG: L-threonylcarbamoyladenylate synthase [Thermodesulfobacteriota bacterium]|nr:L-threonylcarbamoyladenylate synthase [Thermodesulfobacteriota bacterium]